MNLNYLNVFSNTRLIVVLSLLISMVSCAYTQQDDLINEKLIPCETPRTQACTREYQPVCGFESDGNHKTFSNACTACSNPKISSYCDGDCNKAESLSK